MSLPCIRAAGKTTRDAEAPVVPHDQQWIMGVKWISHAFEKSGPTLKWLASPCFPVKTVPVKVAEQAQYPYSLKAIPALRPRDLCLASLARGIEWQAVGIANQELQLVQIWVVSKQGKLPHFFFKYRNPVQKPSPQLEMSWRIPHLWVQYSVYVPKPEVRESLTWGL